MGKTRAQIAARRKTPPTAGVPVGAPMRPVEPDEAETASVRNSDPHRTGADRVTKLRADVSAAQQRLAHKKAHGKLPAPGTKAVAKPESATKASQATPSAAPAFGSPAWRAKYGRKKSAAKPAVTPPIQS
jgi:hypothetical protein